MHDSKFKIHIGGRVAARLAMVAFCILQVAFAAACAKATAADLVPDGPPLAMSAPPPRVIAPVEDVEVTPPAPTNPDPPAPAQTASTPKGTTTRPQAQPKPTPAATETPAAAAQPTPPPPAAPTLEVRSVTAAEAAAEEKKVRDVMARATNNLNTVNYQRLSAEGKAQYDQSKRLNEQADQALKEKNFVYAMRLAENAATFAAELAGR
jgi:hypothetical protein